MLLQQSAFFQNEFTSNDFRENDHHLPRARSSIKYRWNLAMQMSIVIIYLARLQMQCYTVLGGLTMTRSIVVYLINTIYDYDF